MMASLAHPPRLATKMTGQESKKKSLKQTGKVLKNENEVKKRRSK